MRRIAKFLGFCSALISVSMLGAIPWGLYPEVDSGVLPLGMALSIGLSLSAAMILIGGGADIGRMSKGEARAAVALAWILFGVVASLPYIFSGAATDIVNAFFEGVSGITTTGASVMTDIESIPRSVLFWRCLSQWIGGMGIAVIVISLFPVSSAGLEMFSAEVTGPSIDRVAPRIQQTASFMARSYLMLTAAEALILLIFCGLSPFDSLTLALSTVATGGFSPYTANVGHFNSSAVLFVVGVFLFLSASNLSLFYSRILTSRSDTFAKNSEFKFYTAMIVVFSILVTSTLYFSGVYSDLVTAAKESCFHTVSMMSTCGFFVSDYGVWPSSARHIMLLMMFIGGCAVSTSGGITCIRALVMIRHTARECVRVIYPRAVMPLKLSAGTVDDDMVASCFSFFVAYMGVFFVGFASLSLLGIDMSTAFSCAAATLGNVGPGFGLVCPSSGYADLPTAAKLVCTALMLIGRLEIYTLFSLFVRSSRA